MTALSENAPAGVPGTAAPAATQAATPPGDRGKRPRLVHVDAMRPVKQFGVVSTHSVLTFGVAASLGFGGTLMVTHVTRYAFMFISAAMLVYAYPALGRSRLKVFWRRRLLAVVVPYVTWTVIYFLLGVVQSGGAAGVAGNLEHLGYLLLTGYDQLYYLVLLLEFYLVYPLFLRLLQRTERHHWALFLGSLALEALLTWLQHRGLVPGWMQSRGATRELWYYQLYVVAGGVMAWHYHDVHGWICRHAKAILAGTAVAVAVAETWYVLAAQGVPGISGGDPSDPFQPINIPMFLGLIASVYLFGVWLGDSRRPRLVRAFASSGADYSYGIYLSQVLLLTAFAAAGWQNLNHYLPWPAVTGAGIVIVFSASWALSALLVRLPGARGTAGLPRRPWRSRQGNRPAGPGAAGHGGRRPASRPLAQPVHP